MIYFVLIVWILIIKAIAKKTTIREWVVSFSIFGVMALIMGFRSIKVGIDTPNYADLFVEVSKDSWHNIISDFFYGSAEIGYVVFMKMISYISKDYYFFQFVESVIYCFGFAHFIRNNMHNYFLGCILFLGLGMYLPAFNITRQMFAVMIAINSVQPIREKRFIKAAILLLLAMTMHISAIVFLIVPICYYYKSSKVVYVLPIVLLLSLFFFAPLLQVVADNFDKYHTYYDNTRDHKVVMGSSLYSYILFLIISIFAFYFSTKKESEIKIWSLLSMTYIGLVFIGMSFNYVERIGSYFTPFLFFVFEFIGSYILTHKKQRLSKIYEVGVYACFIIFFFLSSLTEQYQYESFF